MKLSFVNEWAVLLSNLGMLFGIVFVGVEVQQNSNLVRASSYNENINKMNEWRYEILADPEYLEYIADYRQEDNLEEFKKLLLIRAQWVIYEQAFYSYSYDLMSEPEWERFRSAACTNFRRAERLGYSRSDVRVEPQFWQYLVEGC